MQENPAAVAASPADIFSASRRLKSAMLIPSFSVKGTSPTLHNTGPIQGGSSIIEQRHEAEIHMKLLMAVKQSLAGIVGHEIDFHFLITAEHDHILDDAA